MPSDTQSPNNPEAALAERLRLADLTAAVGIALTRGGPLQEMLAECAKALVNHLNAAFARIWTLNAAGDTLLLAASEGMYTHLDGPHSRVPVGKFKIGLIAQERKPHLTNSVAGDPRVGDQAWAAREGMVSFAGYPLIVGDRLVGVMAMFARVELSPATLDAMAAVAHGIALGVDRKQAEEALIASRSEVTRILDSITDGFASLDLDLRYRYVNREGARMLGRPAEELIGRSVFEIFATGGESPFGQAFQNCLREQKQQEIEAYFAPLHAWFNLRIFPSGDALAVYYRDVTRRKLSDQRLMAQYAVSRALNAGRPLLETGAGLLSAIGTHLGWRVGQLWIADKRGESLACVCSWQADGLDYGRFTTSSRSHKFARGEGFPGSVWASGEPRWVSDFATHFQFPRAQVASEVTLHSGFAFPVSARGEVVAVAEFLNPDILEPDEELLRTVTAIGHQIGQFLERQWAAEALQESEVRKSAIVETALDAVVTVDGNSRILEFNPAAEVTFGYKREDVLGKLMPELIIPPRFRQAHYAGLSRYLATQEAHVLGKRVELTAVRADGTEFPVELAITRVPIEGEILFTAYLRDITDRKQSEIERAQLLARAEGAQRYYQVLTEAIPQQVWTANPDGSLDFVNKGIAEYFGQPPEHLLDSGWQNFVHPEDVEDCGRKWAACLGSGEPYEVEFRLRRADGSYRWHLGRALPVTNAGGQITKWLGTNTDVHDRIEAEQELRRAKESAESASQAKSDFLASMSHELRTPLNAIIGYSEMLEEEAQESSLEPFISDLPKIHGAGKHLLSLINDVLDLSKIEAGKMELYLESFDVAAMVEAVVHTIRPLAEKNGNQLILETDAVLGSMTSDLTKVRQSLFNLLSNASKFTENGQIRFSVRRVRRGSVEWYTFEVSDTGIGIPADQVNHVFEPFSQVDKGRSRRYGGTGLGLAITRRFCEMMGGQVTLLSELGKGSTFRIQLPSRAGESRQDVAMAEAALLQPNAVLVIDDDPAAQDLMRRFLQREGFQPVSATSGQQALELVKELRPIAITLDVMMPGMDGWAVLTALKSDPVTAEIPVIVVSIVDDKNLGFSLGAAEYLTKPIDRERFSRVLDRYRCSGGNCPVLVVDDDEAVRQTLRSVLERHGWRVFEAEDGVAAIERMQEEQPELILLDLIMPNMDGFEYLERIRENAEWRRIPVIILTSKDLTAEERQQLNGNVERVLRKESYTYSDLVGELCRIAGTRESSS